MFIHWIWQGRGHHGVVWGLDKPSTGSGGLGALVDEHCCGWSPHVRSHRVEAWWISIGLGLVGQGCRTLGDHINEEVALMRKIMSTKIGTVQHRASKEGEKIKIHLSAPLSAEIYTQPPTLLVYSLRLINEPPSHRAQLLKLLPLHWDL